MKRRRRRKRKKWIRLRFGSIPTSSETEGYITNDTLGDYNNSWGKWATVGDSSVKPQHAKLDTSCWILPDEKAIAALLCGHSMVVPRPSLKDTCYHCEDRDFLVMGHTLLLRSRLCKECADLVMSKGITVKRVFYDRSIRALLTNMCYFPYKIAVVRKLRK